ncbi:Uu.00g119640.m01.CDS01 [Anthostomella pinea]|uniref:Uu.00g119640.m01.CDS01 n=1 Tax=Anthostomella pinea TaxID=933095 RepID=A0AAI8VHM2_9PEZI|nr:Uu.00g119640.m01.CDS01 [Anthostomella pinea]
MTVYPLQQQNASSMSPTRMEQPDGYYNLGDPFLQMRVRNEGIALGAIICQFRAIPDPRVPEYLRELWDLSQYGKVIRESPKQLAMLLEFENADLTPIVMRAWTTKYLAPGTECIIVLDPAIPGKDHAVHIHCVDLGDTVGETVGAPETAKRLRCVFSDAPDGSPGSKRHQGRRPSQA